MPRAPTASSAHRRSRVRCRRLTDRRLTQRLGCRRVIGHGWEHLDLESPSDLCRRELAGTGGHDKQPAAPQLGGQPGQRLPQMDDGLEAGLAQDEKRIGPGQQLPDPTGEVGEQSADIDHHVGLEGPEGVGDDRPGPLVGDGLMHAAQPEEHRKAAGEPIHVIPDVFGGEGAPGGSEEGGEASGGSHAIPGSQVAPEGVGLDQEHRTTLRPAGGQGGGCRGDTRRSLDGSESDQGHWAPPDPDPDVGPWLTRESPI